MKRLGIGDGHSHAATRARRATAKLVELLQLCSVATNPQIPADRKDDQRKAPVLMFRTSRPRLAHLPELRIGPP